jgi:hypothetical protein
MRISDSDKIFFEKCKEAQDSRVKELKKKIAEITRLPVNELENRTKGD